MATEVLRPHDVLMAQRMRPIPAFLPGRKPNRSPTPKPSRKTPSPRPEARKRREGSPKQAKFGGAAGGGGNRLVTGQVTILKRGEALDAFKKPEMSVVFGTGRLGPDPEMVPKQIKFGDLKSAAAAAAAATAEMYAGSVFAVSPSPSSLPLPSFSVKKDVSAAIVDHASKDLRRLLRLE